MNQQGYNQFGGGGYNNNQQQMNQMQMGMGRQQPMMGNQMMGQQQNMMGRQQQPMMGNQMMGQQQNMMGNQMMNQQRMMGQQQPQMQMNPMMGNPMQQMMNTQNQILEQVTTTTTQVMGGMGGMGGMGIPQVMGFQPLVDPLQTFFNQVDQDRSGSISAEELRTALNVTPQKLKISIEGCRLLVKMFQTKGFRTFQTKKELSFMEFKNCHTYVCQVMTFFNQVDTDRNGKLNPQELYRACQLSGYSMDFSTFSNIFKRFTQGKKEYSRNSLKMGQFIELSIFLATILKYFNVHRRGMRGGHHKRKHKMKMNVNDKTEMTFGQLVEVVGFFKFGF